MNEFVNFLNFHDLLKQAEQNARTIRDRLLTEADARYQRKLDDLQREYAAEQQAIRDAFGGLNDKVELVQADVEA
jgi:hypothetical protein